MKHISKIAAALALTVSMTANAEVSLSFAKDLQIDVSQFLGGDTADFDNAGLVFGSGDADTRTATFDSFNFANLLATSIYDISDGDVAGSFYDTNVGLPAPGTYGALAGGGTVAIAAPTASQQTITQISPITETAVGDLSDDEGYGSTWSIYTEFTLNGVLDAVGPTYNAGNFKLFFRNNLGADGDAVELLSADLYASNVALNGGNAAVETFFDIKSVISNFFYLQTGGSEVDLATTLDPLANSDTFRVQFVVDPAIPTGESLAVIGNTAVRQSVLSGSAILPVSEPGTLALFGLALLGLGRLRKRNS